MVKRQVRNKCRLSHVRNNWHSFSLLAVIILINVLLFATAARQQYLDPTTVTGFIVFARACGRCLNFCTALVMVLVLRRSLSMLRSFGLGNYLPLDDSVYFHKLVGCLTFGFSVLHTVTHVWNFASIVGLNYLESLDQEARNTTSLKSFDKNGSAISTRQTFTLYEYLFTIKPGIGWVGGSACVTGWLLFIIICIMAAAAQPCVRRTHRFEVFFFTHLLYVPYIFLLVLHAPEFYKWILVPVIIFVVEKCITLWQHYTRKGETYITQATLLTSKVTHLVLRRPPDFNFQPGDYIYLNIPCIASYEWHPFTISSAPEVSGHMTIHVRGVGGWTNTLYDYFNRANLNNNNDLALHQSIKRSASVISNTIINHISSEDNSNQEIILVDGVQLRNKDDMDLAQAYNDGSRDNRNNLKFSTDPDNKNEVVVDVSRTLSVYSSNLRDSGLQYLRKKPNIISIPVQTDILTSENEAVQVPDNNINCVQRQNSIELDHKNVVVNHDIQLWPQPIPVYIMGPYGSPSSDMFRAEHAVMIATGIGVTPFASILQSIMHRYRKARVRCPKCDNCWLDQIPATVMNLRKVDFFWINRDQRSFEWFIKLLSQLEIEQAEMETDDQLKTNDRFLDLHMYITSIMEKTDAKAVFLQMALELMYEKEQRDRVTGLKTRTKPGRPDWDKVFKEISMKKKGKVTVFFCGPPQLGRLLRIKCNEYGFRFKKEKF